jgi:hypothetical protein
MVPNLMLRHRDTFLMPKFGGGDSIYLATMLYAERGDMSCVYRQQESRDFKGLLYERLAAGVYGIIEYIFRKPRACVHRSVLNRIRLHLQLLQLS